MTKRTIHNTNKIIDILSIKVKELKDKNENQY